MAIQKKQPPVSASKNNVKVTDAKMFAPLTTKTPTQTKKSIVPTKNSKPKTTSKPKATSKPKPKATQKPMPDTSKTYNQRLMMKSSPMPMPALDSSMTKIPKGYAGERLMDSIEKQDRKQNTIATMRRGTVSSNGDTTMGKPKRMRMTRISDKEFNR
jgi:hypothetical protein